MYLQYAYVIMQMLFCNYNMLMYYANALQYTYVCKKGGKIDFVLCSKRKPHE